MALTMTVLNSKGGTGKTTAAIFIATALANRGLAVELWDADPQASATEWATDATESGDPLPFDCLPVNRATVKSQESDAQVLIIDMPPGEPSIQTDAVLRADLVIIPTAPSLLDLKRVWVTIDAVGDTPAVVLINAANTQTNNYKATLEALEDERVAVLATTIKNLEVFKNSASTRPVNLAGFEHIAEELLELTEGLK